MTRPAFQRDRDLTDQMNRAALSVLFNISGYYAAHGRRYLSEQELSDLIALNESIARMLRRWQATIS